MGERFFVIYAFMYFCMYFCQLFRKIIYDIKALMGERNFCNFCLYVFLYVFLSTFSKNVSGRVGSKHSLQYITVTRSSVSDRLMMLWV